MIPDKKLFEDSNGLEGFLRNGDEFLFDETLCKVLKELKFNYETNGAYCPRVLVSRIEDNIDMIKKHCENEEDAETYFYMCFPAIAFITRMLPIDEEFKKKHNVEPWHQSLISRTYFDLNTNGRWSYTDSEAEIYLGDKRPFGNSSVTSDIAEEYFNYNDKEITYDGNTFKWHDDEEDYDFDIYDARYEWVNENQDFFWNILDEVNDIIQKRLKEEEYNDILLKRVPRTNGFGGHYTEYWEIDTRVRDRNKKITQLVENE
jgi:hypothetical protein